MQSGDRIGRYVLEELLGEGAMAKVFAARHPVLERRVAIKILQPEARSDPGIEARFLDDARAANVLSHPNIVGVVDVDVDATSGAPFIVMERVDGGSLEEMLDAKGKLTSEEVIRLGLDIARALDTAHGAGIIHRDVKPSNVLVDRKTGRGYLTDFGAAKRFQADQPGRTVHGQLIGTPWYMAPEQLEGAAVDARTDLYALGVTLYQALTGTKPFDASSREGLYRAILLDTPKPVTTVVPDVLPGLDSVVMRLLSKKPDDRPANAAEVVEALLELAMPPPAAATKAPEQPATSPTNAVDPDSPPDLSPPAMETTPARRSVLDGRPQERDPVEPASKEPTMKTKAAIAVVVLVLLIVAGIGWFTMDRTAEQMAEGEVAPAPAATTAEVAPTPAPAVEEPAPTPVPPPEAPAPDTAGAVPPAPPLQEEQSAGGPDAGKPEAQPLGELAEPAPGEPEVNRPAEQMAEPLELPPAPVEEATPAMPESVPESEQAKMEPEPAPLPDPEMLVAAIDEIACANAAADVGGNGKVTLQGTVPDEASRTNLQSAVQGVEGVTEVVSRLEVRPAPGCLATAALAGMPAIGGEPPSIALNRPDGIYADQEMLVITATMPADLGGYLFVDLFSDDGSVVHVLPEKLASANQLPAGATIQIGVEEKDRRNGVRDLRISAPFVPIHIMATVVDKPIYEGLRPLSEPIEDYQKVVEEALGAAAPGSVRQIVETIDLVEKRPLDAAAAP